jgi:uncharacterized protein YjeT (DUF2065 family)
MTAPNIDRRTAFGSTLAAMGSGKFAMSRRLGAVIVALGLMTAPAAFADDAVPPAPPPAAPLAPGQAAGLHAAQSESPNNTIIIVAGVGLVAVGVFLVVGTHYHVPGQNQSTSGTK